ncbi:MAG: B12-binding domain-containing protein [Lacrimispora saccharolytica]
MSSVQAVKENVERGKLKLIKGIVQEALDAGCTSEDLLNQGMIAAMDEVGAKFEAGQLYVPQMLAAAKTMAAGVEVLKPLMKGESGATGKMVMGTVAGDLHDIGKNLVIMMIESAGIEVIDLGVDVPAEKFVETIQANPDINLVGCSALLTTTLESLKNTVAAINQCPNRQNFKVMVGGAPVTQEFADEIGADAYTENAAEAAKKAKELCA